jgi:pimeloyl-ACP methyl ester carboxylesterase
MRPDGQVPSVQSEGTGRKRLAMAPACISVPVRRPLRKDRPSWFLAAEEDRMIPAETQRYMAERMKARVRTIPADHVPMITKAPAAVDIMLQAVREVESNR